MSRFQRYIIEVREALSEGPVQSAMTKMAKARSEKAMTQGEKKHLSWNKGMRNAAANTFNKASRRLGKTMTKNPEEAVEERKHTPAIERRCVADVMKKGKDMAGAFAICRSSMQKAGNYKKGSADLTKKGAKKSIAKSKKKDDTSKFNYFEKKVKAARKK